MATQTLGKEAHQTLRAALPAYRLREIDQTAPAGMWQLAASGGDLLLQFSDDDTWTAATTVVTITDTPSVTITGTLTISGAIEFQDNVQVDGTLTVDGAVTINDTTASSSPTSGALVVAGGLGVSEDIYMAGANFVTYSANAGGNQTVMIQNTSTAANSNALLHMLINGTDTSSDIRIQLQRQVGHPDITWSFGMDNSNSQGMVWSSGTALGTNDRMRLAIADGVLSVLAGGSGTAAQVDVFDDYDDAALAQSFAYSHPSAPEMGLVTPEQWAENRARLVELGVAEWAAQEGGPDELMIHLQPMLRLLAGGIYQTRARVDALGAKLDAIGAGTP